MRQTRPKSKPDQKPETWDSNPGLEYFNSCNRFYCPLKVCLKLTILTKPPVPPGGPQTHHLDEIR